MGKRELVALLNLSSWCLVMVEWLFLEVPWGCLRFVIVVFPDHTHLLFLNFIHHIYINRWFPFYRWSVMEKQVTSTPPPPIPGNGGGGSGYLYLHY